MLRIKFYYFDKQVVWTINDPSIALLAYLLGLSLGFVFVQIIKKIKSKNLRSKNYKKISRGGGDEITEIDHCLGEEIPYIITDYNLINIIKAILNLKNYSRPTVVDKGLFLVAALLHKQFLMVARITGTNIAGLIQSFGFEVAISNIISVATKVGISLSVGTSTMLIAFLLKFTTLQIIGSTTIVAPMIIWFMSTVFPFDCSKLVSQVPQKQLTSTERVLHFVESSSDLNNKIFLKTNEYQEIYYRNIKSQNCKLTEVDKNELIFGDASGEELTYPIEDFKETCSEITSTYIKLKEKTKTIEDIYTKENTKPEITDSIEKVQEAIKTENNNNKAFKPKSKVKEMNERYGPIEKRTQNLEGLNKNKNEDSCEVEESINESSGNQKQFNEKSEEQLRVKKE